ncbi:MAG: efflux RND transporter periplasmic adaptor subunit [Microvirga sp.]|nr:efflux RND transporter periplasmic adaptor subunit [Microvirga sp.]
MRGLGLRRRADHSGPRGCAGAGDSSRVAFSAAAVRAVTLAVSLLACSTPFPPGTTPAAAQDAPLPGFAGNPFAPPDSATQTFSPTIRAQISPRRQTVLSAEIPGKIVHLEAREGDSFAAGERLAGIDCGAHAARLDRAQAQEQGARRRLETAGRLDRLSSISRLEFDEAISTLAAAEAETALAAIFVARCDVLAPFAGRVAARLAQPHQYVAEGEKLIEIIDDSVLEVELIAPSRWLSWLSPGYRFTVIVDELGRAIEARITRIGARVDPVSQSIRVFGAVVGNADGLVAGMSGEASIAAPHEATGSAVR